MGPLVKLKMVASSKTTIACLTTEGLFAGVFPLMSCQLVRSGEFPSAIWIAADIGLFTLSMKETTVKRIQANLNAVKNYL